MQEILVATDFSERSDRALRRAVLLARESGSRIHLVHVVDDDRPRRIVDHETADARTLLGELARTLENVDGVPCSTHVIEADPFAGIAKAVEDVSPDLLVLGPHRRQILRDAFIGTTAERTIREVACPVLMVNGPPVGPYLHTLLTTDLSDNASASLQRFGQLKVGLNAGLSVLHVFDAPALRLAMVDTIAKVDQDAYLHDLRVEALRKLSDSTTTLGGRRPEQIVRHEKTSVAHEILTAAEDLRSDLIVVSTAGKNIVSRFIMGSVTEQVLQSASVDVLAIPPKLAVNECTDQEER